MKEHIVLFQPDKRIVPGLPEFEIPVAVPSISCMTTKERQVSDTTGQGVEEDLTIHIYLGENCMST